MAAMVEDGDLGVGIVQRLAIGVGRAYRNNRIFAAPDNLCGQAGHALEEMRQPRVVQDRLPGKPGVLRTRVLERFELLRGSLTAIKLVVLRRGVVIVNAVAERGAGGDGK